METMSGGWSMVIRFFSYPKEVVAKAIAAME